MIAPHGTSALHSALNYRVQPATGGWSVERDGACLGLFADPGEAIEQACRSAREDAVRDHLAIVTAQTTPQEFHCFLPARGENAAPSPSYLRLLVDNDGGAGPAPKA